MTVSSGFSFAEGIFIFTKDKIKSSKAGVILCHQVLPVALEKAIEESVEYRTGLPIDYLDHLGLVHCDSKSENRKQILSKFTYLMKKLLDYCPVDAAADQMGKSFMHDALPPCLTSGEF